MEHYYQREIETAPRETIRALQTERLIATVRRVYDNVPHYQKRMDEAGVTPADIQSVDDLKKLPFTYKQDLRDTYPYGMFAVPMKDVVRLHASSARPASRSFVGYTKQDLDVWADCCARSIYAAGGGPEDIIQRILWLRAVHGRAWHGRRGAQDWRYDHSGFERQHTAPDYDSKGFRLKHPLLHAVLRAAHGGGLTRKRAEQGRPFAQGGHLWRRTLDERNAQADRRPARIKAFDIYGLTEIIGPGVAFECAEQTGMHVNEDHFLIEVIDPDTGEVLPEGTQGEIVFSCITKQAFPILRYRTRDIGVITRKPCSCGRTLVKMTKPRGRTDDMLIVRGVNVFPSQIETVLLEKGYSANYRIVVDRSANIDSIEVEVEISGELMSDTVRGIDRMERELEAALGSLLGIAAKVKLLEPNTIERSIGKAVRVVDKRKLLD